MRAYVIEIKRTNGRKTRAVISERSASGVAETDEPADATFFANGKDADDAAGYVREAPKFPRGAAARVLAVELGRRAGVWHVAAAGVVWPDAHIRIDRRGLKAGKAKEATKFARLTCAMRAGALLRVAGIRNVDVSVSKTPVLVHEGKPAD